MTQHLDLDALQAELEWCIAEGHSGPRTHACLKSLQPLIDRLRKAEAALDGRKLVPLGYQVKPIEPSLTMLCAGMMEANRHRGVSREMLACVFKQMNAAAPDSTPTDSAEKTKGGAA